MLFLVSFHFLDLRFWITRVSGDDTRDTWLKPRWLWPSGGFGKLGRLGPITPIPGRGSSRPTYQYATAEGGRILQTAAESQAEAILCAPELNGFLIHNREIVADPYGQVRLDLLLEKPVTAATLRAVLEDLLNLDLAVPLRKDTVRLADGANFIAGLYESESNWTIADPGLRKEALAAAANTVITASDAPNIVLIDLAAELDMSAQKPITCCMAPRAAELRLSLTGIAGAEVLLWHLRPIASAERQQAWDAAFDLACMVGRLHELSVFKTSVEECAQHVRPQDARSAVKFRINRFGEDLFGGWESHKVMAAAASALWSTKNQEKDVLDQIKSFGLNAGDASSLAGNVTNVINNYNWIAEEIKVAGDTFSGTFNNSILNTHATLNDVSQSIGALPNADQATKEALTKLVADLQAQLKAVPQEQAGAAATLAAATKDVVDKAKDPAADKGLLQYAIDGLKRAAEVVKQAVPAVVTIVGGIVALIAKIHGIPIP